MKIYIGTTAASKKLIPMDISGFKDACEKYFNNPMYGSKDGLYFTTASEIQEISGEYNRLDEHHLSSWCVVIDGDKTTDDEESCIPPNEVHKVVKKLNLNHAIYSTYSHIPSKQKYKWRLVLPCNLQGVEQHRATIATIYKLLFDKGLTSLKAVAESFRMCQLWYLHRSPNPSIFEYYDYHNGIDFVAQNDFPKGWEQVPGMSLETQTTKNSTPECRNLQTKVDPDDRAPDMLSKNAVTEDKIIEVLVTGGHPLHESMNKFIYGRIKDGTTPAATKAILHGLTYSWNLSDKRLADRKKDIDRLVDYAAKKFQTDQDIDNSVWSKPKPIPNPEDLIGHSKFPLEILPMSFLTAANAIADFNLASVHDIVPSMIAAVCIGISRKGKIDLGVNSLESFFHLGVVNIAPSGYYKSSVYDQVITGVEEAETELIDEFLKEEPMNQSKERLLEKAKNKIETGGGQQSGVQDILRVAQELGPILDELDKLKNRRRPGSIADDITQEGAVEKCYKAGGCINYVAAEGQSFIQSLKDKYNSGNGTSNDFLIRGLTGDRYRNSRKSGEDRDFIPVSTCLVFVQPDIYKQQMLSDKAIYSSGLAARLIPVEWESLARNNRLKNDKNLELEQKKVQPFWDITKFLTLFDDRTAKTRFDTKDSRDNLNPSLIRPVTKIRANPKLSNKYIDMFNGIRTRYKTDLKGKEEATNKCLSTAYIMAGCLYAYENYKTFFNFDLHEMDEVFCERVERIVEYLINIKSREFETYKAVIDVKGAIKVLERLTSNANRENALKGLTPSVFGRIFNINRKTVNKEEIDQGQRMLERLGYLKMIDNKITLNPRWRDIEEG